MTDLPDVLKPFVEDEEENGALLAVCDPECRVCSIIADEDAPPALGGMVWWAEKGLFVVEDGVASVITDEQAGFARCPACGTLVGFDEDGQPFRVRFSRIVEALAHRDRALTWLVAQVSLPANVDWAARALAATEEANQ